MKAAAPPFSRNRLIAAIALLALALGVVTAGPRAGATAGLLAATGDGERWLVNFDDSQPAKIERGLGLGGDKGASGSPPLSKAAVHPVRAAAKRPQALHIPAARPASTGVAAAGPAHRRPDPTGPPLLG